MKKQLLALAALAAVSGVAVAQNVTIYGQLDAGVLSVSKPTTGTGSAFRFNNGGEAPSILGFKGSEDLGGGLKASFALESHISTDTGASNAAIGGSALFARQANVSLGNSSATVTLGRQYTPALLAFAATDPRGVKEQYSGLMTWALSGTPGANNTIDVFSSNGVTVNTNLGGVNVGAMYGIGGVAGNSSAKSEYSLGLSGSVQQLTWSAGLQGQNDDAASTAKNKKVFAGLGYKVTSNVTVKGNYMQAQQLSSGSVAHSNTVWGLGADIGLGANTLTFAFYNGNDSKVANTSSKSYIVSNDYSLSKRTNLYVFAASSDTGSAVTSVNSGVVAARNGVDGYQAGATVTSIGAGVVHRF